MNSPADLSAETAACAPIAAPHAADSSFYPSLLILPTYPVQQTPTCGAYSTTMCPFSGTCALKAAQPVFPVKGNPASPANGKISPHLLVIRDEISSSGSSWLISSGHEQSA